jgi:hypothetical protein
VVTHSAGRQRATRFSIGSMGNSASDRIFRQAIYTLEVSQSAFAIYSYSRVGRLGYVRQLARTKTVLFVAAEVRLVIAMYYAPPCMYE